MAAPRKLTPISEAFDALLPGLNQVADYEEVDLLSACGRVLAQDCVSDIDVPPHANSAMDGYAIVVGDQQVGSVLKITQRIAAGVVGKPLKQGQAARIFTGAVIPEGSNAVVMQENCRIEDDNLYIQQAVVEGENLRRAGEDVTAGRKLLQKGHRLLPQDIGLLASIGHDSVAVKRKLKVALMTTGDELIEPGTALKPGQIYNSNFYTLYSLLAALPVEVLDFGIIGDDFDSTRQALKDASVSVDCIITTGGVSVGEEDHVKAAVEAEGKLELWKLAIKPGKPLACGKLGNAQFFGLPGNPVSAFVTFALVVRPCLLSMLECESIFANQYQMKSGFESAKSGERQEYLRAMVSRDKDHAVNLIPYSNQSSGVGASLSNADGLLIIPPHCEVKIGDNLDFIPFNEILN
ncbi:MAG: molybdopterin molybdotransferase MoeA [Gammaproteobacteria bacterium]|mgnify:FL=1|jgi:molybdopterin molybdotransferase|nr:molybdopterin molybdotransferase MoeA [Gammaproteobacteria bacterium]MBT3859784.1 molybdopterin molybdotransferase MoeA [Gammaproteobacteria bacterium]MBT3988821.1 molybdopterin molybdotransferase MoeA [Gammaproteobacteria bacterium]MBT4580920.1 molybdopterin molybdotransferase MoeA [Gammaproteobacteria bacterium]MBT4660250.1 molybdopterin molybdotransferase MoeA [Gammaproteobacteria bacterium]